jgi:hypothetical protein
MFPTASVFPEKKLNNGQRSEIIWALKEKRKAFRYDHLSETRFSWRTSKKFALELGTDFCGLGQGSVRVCCKDGEVSHSYIEIESFSARWVTVWF